MFGWFASVFRRSPAKTTRATFDYYDGMIERRGDPFALWRRIMHHPTIDFRALAPLVDEGREPESSQWLAGIREVFGLSAYDDQTGRGLTDRETVSLFVRFSEYLAGVKKKPSPGPT